MEKITGEKLHTRTMTVSTFLLDERRMLVEGTIRDERFQEYHTVAGQALPAGVFHHMTIRLQVQAATLLIEEIAVEMETCPEEVCRETLHCLDAIKGLSIAKGFTMKVKKLAGGKQGCTHLMELLLVMAPAAFQGQLAFVGRKPAVFDLERARAVIARLIDTCHAWREGGLFAERFKAYRDQK
jgi:hypothetical protein